MTNDTEQPDAPIATCTITPYRQLAIALALNVIVLAIAYTSASYAPNNSGLWGTVNDFLTLNVALYAATYRRLIRSKLSLTLHADPLLDVPNLFGEYATQLIQLRCANAHPKAITVQSISVTLSQTKPGRTADQQSMVESVSTFIADAQGELPVLPHRFIFTNGMHLRIVHKATPQSTHAVTLVEEASMRIAIAIEFDEGTVYQRILILPTSFVIGSRNDTT